MHNYVKKILLLPFTNKSNYNIKAFSLHVEYISTILYNNYQHKKD